MNYVINQQEFYQYKQKIHARRELNKAVREGNILRPERCESCACRGRIEGHHVDYGRPLDVVWLCKSCHKETMKCHHPLNHAKFVQTKGVTLKMDDKLPITLTLSLDSFAMLKKVSEEREISMSKVIESLIRERYPSSQQLMFNFEEHEKTINNKDKELSDLSLDENRLHKQKQYRIQELRRKRDQDLSFMDDQLFSFSARTG